MSLLTCPLRTALDAGTHFHPTCRAWGSIRLALPYHNGGWARRMRGKGYQRHLDANILSAADRNGLDPDGTGIFLPLRHRTIEDIFSTELGRAEVVCATRVSAVFAVRDGSCCILSRQSPYRTPVQAWTRGGADQSSPFAGLNAITTPVIVVPPTLNPLLLLSSMSFVLTVPQSSHRLELIRRGRGLSIICPRPGAFGAGSCAHRRLVSYTGIIASVCGRGRVFRGRG